MAQVVMVAVRFLPTPLSALGGPRSIRRTDLRSAEGGEGLGVRFLSVLFFLLYGYANSTIF